jgi:hypothetical protein
VVEPALAKALVLAAKAQRWELVAQIATELDHSASYEKGCGHHDRRETGLIVSLPLRLPRDARSAGPRKEPPGAEDVDHELAVDDAELAIGGGRYRGGGGGFPRG